MFRRPSTGWPSVYHTQLIRFPERFVSTISSLGTVWSPLDNEPGIAQDDLLDNNLGKRLLRTTFASIQVLDTLSRVRRALGRPMVAGFAHVYVVSNRCPVRVAMRLGRSKSMRKSHARTVGMTFPCVSDPGNNRQSSLRTRHSGMSKRSPICLTTAKRTLTCSGTCHLLLVIPRTIPVGKSTPQTDAWMKMWIQSTASTGASDASSELP